MSLGQISAPSLLLPVVPGSLFEVPGSHGHLLATCSITLTVELDNGVQNFQIRAL